MTLLDSFLSYRGDKAQYKASKQMQKWRNTMVNLSNAVNQNNITQNVTNTIRQSARRAVSMRRDELGVMGSATVAAASAGVRGRSVQATFFDVSRKAGQLERQREIDLEGFFQQATAQRVSSALSAAQNQDYTYIPKPSLGRYIMKDLMQSASMFAGGFGQGMQQGKSQAAFKGTGYTPQAQYTPPDNIVWN